MFDVSTFFSPPFLGFGLKGIVGNYAASKSDLLPRATVGRVIKFAEGLPVGLTRRGERVQAQVKVQARITSPHPCGKIVVTFYVVTFLFWTNKMSVGNSSVPN